MKKGKAPQGQLGMKVKGHEGQLSKRSLVLKGRKSARSLVQQVTCPKVRCTEVTWQRVDTEKVSCLSTVSSFCVDLVILRTML